jgi:hypothetical protein
MTYLLIKERPPGGQETSLPQGFGTAVFDLCFYSDLRPQHHSQIPSVSSL